MVCQKWFCGFVLLAAVSLLTVNAGAAALSTTPSGGSNLPAGVVTLNGAVSVYNLDVTGIASMDLLGDSDNVVMVIDVATALGITPPVKMTGIGWNVTLEAFDPSYLSDIRVYFDDNIAPDQSGLFLTPGISHSFPGAQSYNSGGILDLTDNAVPDIPLPNGLLRVEFYEDFEDFANTMDGRWVSGTLQIQIERASVPEPAAVSLTVLGGLMLLPRRRGH